MATGTKWAERRNRWLLDAGWATGIGIALVEMQWGMDYVEANVVEHAKAIVGWLPMIVTLLCRFGGSPAGQYQSVEAMMRLLPLTVPCGLWALGLMMRQRAAK